VILWSLSHLEAARFACDLEHVAWTVGRRPRAGAWDHLAALASAHGRALASWYRALALVMFAAARWRT
jgi:hypothetical protein